MPRLWAASLDEHRALVLDRLVDAYVSLVRDRGVEDLTVAAVARRADLARSAVYNHVDHLHDLALVHTEDTITRWVAGLRDARPGHHGAWAAIEDLVVQSMAMFAEDPLAGLDLATQLDEQRAAHLRELMQPLMTHLLDTVTAGVASGEFVDEDPRELTTFVWACLSGYRTMVGNARLPADVASATAVRLLQRTLVASPSRVASPGDAAVPAPGHRRRARG